MSESFRTMAIATPGTSHAARAAATYASKPAEGSRGAGCARGVCCAAAGTADAGDEAIG
jgi:hypothetical protein